MKASYQDIRNRIEKEPMWYDENGTPRYKKFHPDLSPNIYAREVILLKIACQHCHRRFLVEMNFGTFDLIKGDSSFTEKLDLFIKSKKRKIIPPVHYGDPPIHGCIGDTENCYDLRIVEFWINKFEYKRIKKYEIELEKDDG